MKYFSWIILIQFLTCLGRPGIVKCQPIQETLSIEEIVPGYKKIMQGNEISFHSSNPDVTEALIARNIKGNNEITWKTAIIPEEYNKKYIYFVWLAGLATGNGRQNSSYDLLINGENVFEINIRPGEFPQNWTQKRNKGFKLSFIQHSLDDNKDVFGYMYLKVPVAEFEKGKPLVLKMIGEKNSRYDDWYMTFQHEVKERVSMHARPLLRKKNNKLQQLVDIQIEQIFPEPVDASYSLDANIKKEATLKPGYNNIKCWLPAVENSKDIPAKVNIPNIFYLSRIIRLDSITKREVYLIPHSHTDIGYTNLQPVVAKQHSNYIREAIKIIAKSKNNPTGSQFKWNVESLWTVYNFMESATAKEKQQFLNDVKAGYIGLSAGYINLLTGISRPVELIHWTDYADTLRQRYGIHFKSLMESDVPGMNWNVVSALSQRGICYISDGPNYINHKNFPDKGARVGATHRALGDKPFYWISPSKRDTVLYWQAGKGYSAFNSWDAGPIEEKRGQDTLLTYMQKLQDEYYPYKMIQLRYSIADNGPPDSSLPDFVAKWNKKYVSPKIVISTVDEMMGKFETRNSSRIPVMRGDFTPYWTDGAMSTAKEEVMVKHSEASLYQSEVLNTLLYPGNYKRKKYYQAWRDVLMWHEHSWGAGNSVSDPDNPMETKEWHYKKNFALQADKLSHELLEKSLKNNTSQDNKFTVINTSSWQRTNLVKLTPSQSTAGDIITDNHGKVYPSQRLSDGRLVFLAKNVPALGSKIFYNKKGHSSYKSSLRISNNRIQNDDICLILDDKTGAIKSLINKRSHKDFVNTKKYRGLNQYIYVPGRDPSKAVSTNNVSIYIKEKGPLIDTYEIKSKAPGTHLLTQEVSLINGLNKVAITDIVDKTKNLAKESVHFAFPAHVHNGQMRVDLGTTTMKPGEDQLPGANKDFYSVQRWVDVSNKDRGLTLTTRDTPLVEEGALVNEIPVDSSKGFGGLGKSRKWKEHATISNTFFSYVMNNYWYTNYRAFQQGKVAFHYDIYLHKQFSAATATRQGMQDCQPLIVTGGNIKHDNSLPFKLSDRHILLTSAKPSKSGNGSIIRLYNASSKPQNLHLKWNKDYRDNPPKIYVISDMGAKQRPLNLKKPWSAFAVRTLYVER